jgi:hypothetical protein
LATTNDEIEQALVTLAKDVAQTAKTVDAFADKIDALKTLTAVYAALKKHKTDDPDEDQGDGFDFSKGLSPEEPPDGGTVTPLRTRRRPG